MEHQEGTMNHRRGIMKKAEVLSYRSLMEKAAEFELFMDRIESSCSRESNAAFLYLGDNETDAAGHEGGEIAGDARLRRKVLAMLIDCIQREDANSPLHRMMMTHGELPVYVRALHIVRDFWYVEIQVRLPEPGGEESDGEHETVLHIAYFKGSGQRIRTASL